MSAPTLETAAPRAHPASPLALFIACWRIYARRDPLRMRITGPPG